MRIINVSASRRHFAYANVSEGGRDLDPGESGPDIPLSKLFAKDKIIWADVGNHIAQFKLSENDKAHLRRILTEGERKVKVAKLPGAVSPPKPKPKPEPKPEPKSKAKPKVKAPAPPARPVGEEEVAGGGIDLAALQRANTITSTSTPEEKQAKLAKIQSHTGGPLGSIGS